MALIIGDLRHKIVIYELSVTKGDYGEADQHYTPVATIRAAVKYISGNKVVENEEIFNTQSVQFTTHYRPIIQEHMLIGFKDKNYRILQLAELGFKEGLQITTELINDTIMINDGISEIAGSYGAVPVATGAQTITAAVASFEAWEDTVFGVFRDQKGDEITTHPWKGKTLKENRFTTFGPGVAQFTITSGGLGQYFKSGEEMQQPALVSLSTNALGTKVILTFDRTMSNPSTHAADFTVEVNEEADVITAAALGSNTKTIELTLTTAVVFGDSVTLAMAAGNIISAWSKLAAAIETSEVTNIVEE